MPAALIGSKRSFFYDPATSPPVTKRHRFSSSSPSCLDHLRAVFPDIDAQLLERVLEECGNDLDSAIKSLKQHSLGPVDESLGLTKGEDADTTDGLLCANGGAYASEKLSAPNNLPTDGAGWVELLVSEMWSATNIDVARVRASRVLELLEKSLSARAAEKTSESYYKEKMALGERWEALHRDNNILKRAVAIQHERQKEHDTRNQELQHMKLLVPQYQEQLRKLEMQNYALTMHLKQAQQSSSIPGHFHPDVF